jgi:hypothetical protein
MMLESAYAAHTVPDVVETGAGDARRVFKILLDGGEQGLLDVSYYYEAASARPVDARIVQLPKQWELILRYAAARTPVVVVKQRDEHGRSDCSFAFGIRDPFFARAFPTAGSVARD